MGYRIEYGQTVTKETFQENNKTVQTRRNVTVILFITVAFVLLCYFCMDSLKGALFPGDPKLTEAALAAFVEDVKAGQGIKDALFAFCKEIIKGANIF